MSDRRKRDCPADWSLAAVRIGRSTDRSKNLLVADAPSDEHAELAYYIWFIRHAGDKAVLIDVGFSPDRVGTRTVESTATIEDSCELLGVSELSAIVISHLHWDHAGNVDIAPAAPVYVSAEEFAWLHSVASADGPSLYYYDERALERWRECDRLSSFQGQTLLGDGRARVRVAGGHTVGHSVVEVPGADARFCLMGDLAYLEENLMRRVAPTLAVDQERCTEIYERYSNDWIRVPGHDPRTLDRLGHRINEHVAVVV